MTKTESKIDGVAARKAAKFNLTVDQLWIGLELISDIERVSEGSVQGMSINALNAGCEIRLHSMDATYYVRVARERLELVGEGYGKLPLVLHEAQESIAAWELIRQRILYIEGWVDDEPEYRQESESQFDTCQKSETQTEIHT